ncbi:hypothetical protein BC939DRAFT_437481 [Gamsiella multidivaricata]|uniref:uncharacterized protein n=1 Tax=Gamsiella multidivaricata TaxID=101098 RepID=UPI00221E4803|nr:uncharacterized protein BC939DRAFT_437481 [Gamsiella multidivaricata]KAI7831587.1 hypothetical protein BC939DRAFT_437481 [Gamsiella multidivaricata]
MGCCGFLLGAINCSLFLVHSTVFCSSMGRADSSYCLPTIYWWALSFDWMTSGKCSEQPFFFHYTLPIALDFVHVYKLHNTTCNYPMVLVGFVIKTRPSLFSSHGSSFPLRFFMVNSHVHASQLISSPSDEIYLMQSRS